MYNVRAVTENLYWVGANDHRLHLFENIYLIPRGVSYNAYLLLDKKTVLFDTVDWSACRQYLENIQHVLGGRKLDYLIINHMEPDHAACIEEVLIRYPEACVVCTEKAYFMMEQFGFKIGENHKIVTEGDQLSFGKHQVVFIEAPMVHWPETMVTFDLTNGVLFSADAFGPFGALDGKLFNDEVNFDRDWLDDARRYFTNIVGKYGPPVQALLKKAGTVDIKMLCPLHGPVWRTDLGYLIGKYDLWSRYEPEDRAVMIAYASMYGNTENTAGVLATKLCERGITNVVMYDVSNTDQSHLISETFRCSHIVLASVTYNLGVYPKMKDYIHDMKALNIQNRTVGIIENGSWACKSGDLMRELLDSMKDMRVLDDQVSLASAMDETNRSEMGALADAIAASVLAQPA